MLKLVQIKVECFAGFRADEYPKYIHIDNNKLEICEIRDRWYQITGSPESPAANYFRVETTCGQEFIIKHNLENDEWYRCS